jgi:hypothetical protein
MRNRAVELSEPLNCELHFFSALNLTALISVVALVISKYYVLSCFDKQMEFNYESSRIVVFRDYTFHTVPLRTRSSNKYKQDQRWSKYRLCG